MKKFGLILLVCFSAFVVGASAQQARSISEVQGDKSASPYVGETARLAGIVTARTRTGFFLQTPDDKTDNNPNTSEGIFVFTRTEPPTEAAIGNIVSVSGTIEEFRPKADPQSLPVTQLSMRKGTDTITVESKGSSLPKPIILTAADFKPNSIEQLEKFEGMRVTVAEMTVIAPTGGRVDENTGASESDGTFYG